MVFFKYLANILQHPNLNGCFFENSENKTANAFSSIFAGSDCSYGDEWTNNYDDYKVKICALSISF